MTRPIPFRALGAILLTCIALAAGPVAAQGLGSLVPGLGGGSSSDATGGTDGAEAGTPLAQLLDILKDPEARDALIAELEAATTGGSGDAATGDTARGDAGGDAAGGTALDDPAEEATSLVEDVAGDAMSLGRRIANATTRGAENIADSAAGLWRQTGNIPRLFDGIAQIDLGMVVDAVISILWVILVTFAILIGLRRLVRPLYGRMGDEAEQAGFLRQAVLFVSAGLIDLGVVVLAWAGGYAVTIAFIGEPGQIGVRQSLYLNAFLAVGVVRWVLRLFLSPSTHGLRIVPVSNAAARRVSSHLGRIAALLGYTQLLAIPIINAVASHRAGRSVTALAAVIAVVWVAILIFRHRHAMTAWAAARFLPDTAEAAGDAAEAETARAEGGGKVMMLARGLWIATLLYLGWMLTVILSLDPVRIGSVLEGSGRILAAVVIGGLAAGALTRAITSGVRLPEHVKQRLPLLEGRLNAVVPWVLIAVRLIIVVAVAVFALSVVGLFDIRAWFAGGTGLSMAGTLTSVAIILAILFAIWLALNSYVDYRLNPEFGQVATSRETTLLTLMRNAGTIAILIIGLMMVLSELGLNIGPLIASAGILGLAIGFGAQKLVEDIITGIFIQFERAINVGDVVTVGGITGAVERLTVRSVSLRDVNGIYHLIPFSSASQVSNWTRDFAFAVFDMGVAYREDYDDAKQAMFDAFDELKQDPEYAALVLADLEWFGLDSFGDNAVILKSRIKTLPGKQWMVMREYNRIVKRVFDARGIEIPFPHRTLYWGEAKDGTTQTVRVAGVDAPVPTPVATSGPVAGPGSDRGAAHDGRQFDGDAPGGDAGEGEER